MKREEGYYWIKSGSNDWEIAKYEKSGIGSYTAVDGFEWIYMGRPLEEDLIQSIDERRIHNPDEEVRRLSNVKIHTTDVKNALKKLHDDEEGK